MKELEERIKRIEQLVNLTIRLNEKQETIFEANESNLKRIEALEDRDSGFRKGIVERIEALADRIQALGNEVFILEKSGINNNSEVEIDSEEFLKKRKETIEREEDSCPRCKGDTIHGLLCCECKKDFQSNPEELEEWKNICQAREIAKEDLIKRSKDSLTKLWDNPEDEAWNEHSKSPNKIIELYNEYKEYAEMDDCCKQWLWAFIKDLNISLKQYENTTSDNKATICKCGHNEEDHNIILKTCNICDCNKFEPPLIDKTIINPTTKEFTFEGRIKALENKVYLLQQSGVNSNDFIKKMKETENREINDTEKKIIETIKPKDSLTKLWDNPEDEKWNEHSESPNKIIIIFRETLKENPELVKNMEIDILTGFFVRKLNNISSEHIKKSLKDSENNGTE